MKSGFGCLTNVRADELLVMLEDALMGNALLRVEAEFGNERVESFNTKK